MNNMLEVTALSKSYTDFTLDNITFRLPEGFIMGLIGPNGSGKTTTIKSILNMVEPDSGNITVFGKDHLAQEQEIKGTSAWYSTTATLQTSGAWPMWKRHTPFSILDGTAKPIGLCYQNFVSQRRSASRSYPKGCR